MSVMEIRAGTAADLPFLEQMLFEAFFWNGDTPRPVFAMFREQPAFSGLVAGWGRPGDRSVVAAEGSAPRGAAWFRLWTPENHSYGFVDVQTPELGIAVAPAHRGRGAGRALLQALVRTARDDGHAALSLSVSPDNAARRLYEREGFRRIGESGTSWTYLLTL